MKIKYLLLFSLVLAGCVEPHTPDTWVNGKAFYTEKYCVSSELRTSWTYHYGYSFRGKFEFFYGPQRISSCVEYGKRLIAIPNQTPNEQI